MLNSQVKLIEALRKSSNFFDYTFFFYLELICLFFLVCLGFFYDCWKSKSGHSYYSYMIVLMKVLVHYFSGVSGLCFATVLSDNGARPTQVQTTEL